MYIWDREGSPPLASEERGNAFVSRRPCWPAALLDCISRTLASVVLENIQQK